MSGKKASEQKQAALCRLESTKVMQLVLADGYRAAELAEELRHRLRDVNKRNKTSVVAVSAALYLKRVGLARSLEAMYGQAETLELELQDFAYRARKIQRFYTELHKRLAAVHA